MYIKNVSNSHLGVEILYGGGYLIEVKLGFGLVQLGLVDDLVEELASLGKLQHDEEVVGGVDEIFQLDYIGVINRLQYLDFIQNPVEYLNH